ncbi:O-antigen ligase family protein [Bacillus massiliigorillae]|uniref:O-antigen ligase family protein n=1 Tax=Bacillus massiliigorillae TaxID=1243664 RepID=UPI0005A73AEF|nr:O-antigen ligase family protein [Bacillus massiliigorillae]
MNNNRSLTYILVLLHLFLVPLVYFKKGIISIEVILIPLLVLAFLWEYRKGTIKLNSLPILPFLITFGLYVIISAISLVNAVALTPGIMEIARFLSYVVVFLIAIKVQFTKEQYINFAKAFGAAAIIVGLFGIIQYIFNISLNKAGLYALQEAKGRVDSTLINPNYYSSFLNFVIPSFLLLAVVYFKDKKVQLMFFAFYAVFIVNLILTYTRAAWVTMACAFVLIILIMPKRFLKNFVKPHILIAFVILLTGVYFMPDVQSRTQSAIYAVQKLVFPNAKAPASDIKDKDPEDLTPEEREEIEKEKQEEAISNTAVVSRVTLWKTGLYMYKDNPVLGVGMGNYYTRYKEFVTKYPELDIGHDAYSVHNSYIKVAAETGTIGILAFLSIYVAYFIYLIRLYFKQNDELGKIVAAGVFVGSITFMVQNLSNNLIFIPQLNIIFWLVGGLAIAFLHLNQNRSYY